MPAAWAALAASAPQVRLDVTQMEPEEALPAVLRGETDVAVVHEYDLLPRPLDPLFERRELRLDPVVIAVPASHSLAAAGGPVPLSDLSGLPFLAPRDTTSCAWSRRARALPWCPAWPPAASPRWPPAARLLWPPAARPLWPPVGRPPEPACCGRPSR